MRIGKKIRVIDDFYMTVIGYASIYHLLGDLIPISFALIFQDDFSEVERFNMKFYW